MSDSFSNVPVVPGGSTSIVQTWVNALTKPSEQTFAEMAASPQAKASTAYLWVFIGTLVQFFAAALVQGTLLREVLRQQGLAENVPVRGLGMTLLSALCGAPIMAVISVIFFAIMVALIQWLAKMFGGRGTFDQLAYAFGAIVVPLSLISAVLTLLGAIPFIGFCFGLLGLLAGLYALVLQIMAAKGVHQFGWGPAAGSVLIPPLAVATLCCCAILVAGTLMGAALGNVLSTLNQSLIMP